MSQDFLRIMVKVGDNVHETTVQFAEGASDLVGFLDYLDHNLKVASQKSSLAISRLLANKK